MSDNDARVFARIPFVENQSITTERLEAISKMGQRNASDGILAMLLGGYGDNPLRVVSGFLGAESFMPVKGGGDLGVDIYPGFGICDRVGLAEVDPTADPYEPNLVPIYLRNTLTLGVPAHHATLTRVDRIVVRQRFDDDTSAKKDEQDREVFNTSILEWQNVTAFGYIETGAYFSVIQGTPGSGSPPTVPSGFLLIANIYVPATSGPVVVQDVRTMLTLGNDLSVPQAPTYAQNFVKDGCVPSATGADMFVDIGDGEIIGQWTSGSPGSARRYIFEQRAEIGTADPTDPRVDAVVLSAGVALVLPGTPDATNPQPPEVDPSFVRLAYVFVSPGATVIDSGKVLDARTIRPYHAQTQSVITIDPKVTLEPDGSGFRVLRVEVADWDALGIASQAVWFEIEMVKNNLTAPSTTSEAHFNAPTAGTVEYGVATVGGTSKVVVYPSNLGVFEIAITDVAAPSGLHLLLSVRPIMRVSANNSSELARSKRVPRYRAGQAVMIDMVFAD
jgi:hypothetical protein